MVVQTSVIAVGVVRGIPVWEFEVELTEFSDGFGCKVWKEKKSQGLFEGLWPEQLKDGIAINWDVDSSERGRFGRGF